MMRPLLDVQNLTIELTTRDGVAPVIDDLSFSLNAGETLSFVGESGCGKSMTALALMGLLPANVGRISSGHILFEGADLAQASDARLRKIRGNDISMIFQEPMTSLNPVLTIGEQIAEVLRAHQGLSRKAAWEQAIALLDAVRIPNPKGRAGDYPFPNVRWATAKGDDRDGSGLCPQNSNRRRADHRAGCHRSGANF